MKKCSPLALRRKCRDVISPEKAIGSDLPTLARVRRSYGPDFLEGYIAIWIANLLDFIQVSRKMGEAQITETAMMIAQDYYMLNLADIHLVFTRAKKGEWGPMYERLDGATILSWFARYLDERMDAGEAMTHREHERHISRGDQDSSALRAIDDQRQAMHRYGIEKLMQKVSSNNEK